MIIVQINTESPRPILSGVAVARARVFAARPTPEDGFDRERGDSPLAFDAVRAGNYRGD